MSYDKMNRYWLPNVEINKKVITQELQFYLGPEAHVRPYTRDVSTLSSICLSRCARTDNGSRVRMAT